MCIFRREKSFGPGHALPLGRNVNVRLEQGEP
jgi:hypothetical protein